MFTTRNQCGTHPKWATDADVPDMYGPTVTEAMRALDASFEKWRRQGMNRS
jgi:hypothetical protein